MAVIDNLIGYWPLDEASGDATDVHGSNTLTDTNTVGAATGKVSGARAFTASNSEYFTHADNPALSMGDFDFTWAGWIQTASDDNIQDFVSKWDASGNQHAWVMRRANSAGLNYFLVYFSSDGSNALSVTDATSRSINTWYFVVAGYDSAADVVFIQVNNGAVTTAAHGSGIFDNSAALLFGAITPSSPALFVDGLMDEWGFWKKVLTTDERTWLYNSGNGRSYADIVAEGGGGPTLTLVGRSVLDYGAD